MNLTFAYMKTELINFFRQPSYVTSTLVFPSVFFMFFALPNVNSVESAQLMLGSFSCYAVLSVVFFQFSVTTAMERASQWQQFLKTLPVSFWQWMSARLFVSLAFALLSALILMFTVILTTELEFSLALISKAFVALIVAGLPFCFMGLTIGYLVSEQSAIPVSNLFYLPLSFAGGLWLPPEALPKVVQEVSLYLPSRHYGEILWSICFDQPLPTKSVYHLIGALILSALIFTIVYRLDRSKRRL